MKTAYEYLKANPVFHLATVEDGKGRVRPFRFRHEKKQFALFLYEHDQGCLQAIGCKP